MIRKLQSLTLAGLALAIALSISLTGPAPSRATAGTLVSTVTGATSSLLTVTKTIDGLTGGSVSNGRWTIRMPAGAFVGVGKVSLGVGSASATACELGILPIGLNRFAVPATLVAQFPRGTDLSGCVIERYEPATNRWQAVAGSRADSNTGQVSAPLDHFSSYRVQGKSGW